MADKSNNGENACENDEKSKDKCQGSATYITYGLALGVVFGMIFHNLALCLALGVAIGAAIDSNNNKKAKDRDSRA